MKQEAIAGIIEKQRRFFGSGATLDVNYRIKALKKLLKWLDANEEAVALALEADLGKSQLESYMCETGMVRSEISYMLRHIRKFAKEQTVATPLAQFAARSYRKPMPYGVSLIMSPWNYPFMLSVEPLVDALAAGNTVVLKPSAYSPATSELLGQMIGELFPAEYVAVIQGGREENALLLDQKFDCIFFTGSKAVGQTVLEKAARHLTPVTLELGGKSPCIVDESAKLELAARRIVFGKFLNCGQTCVAPDYILCHRGVKDRLIRCLKAEITRQYGTDYRNNPLYGKMISRKHFDRVTGLIDHTKVVHGGHFDPDALKIEPTVMDGVTWEDPVMGEEIFGPLLPILTFENFEELVPMLANRPKPLALYLFSRDRTLTRRMLLSLEYGTACVNDVPLHGMAGCPHGKDGFDLFSIGAAVRSGRHFL
jgi:aldehyde dehydrogenase (NAD+)